MSRVIHILNDLSYMAGIIGLSELHERNEIASWIFSRKGSAFHDSPDPRGACEKTLDSDLSLQDSEIFQPVHDGGEISVAADQREYRNKFAAIQFLVLKRWYFTLGDADCHPSVPHGHTNSKTQRWPKLNPYTGRVFSAMHTEDVASRLSRQEMQLLWQDNGFIDFCREQVSWYASQFPHYNFANARRGLLAFPRWRVKG